MITVRAKAWGYRKVRLGVAIIKPGVSPGFMIIYLYIELVSLEVSCKLEQVGSVVAEVGVDIVAVTFFLPTDVDERMYIGRNELQKLYLPCIAQPKMRIRLGFEQFLYHLHHTHARHHRLPGKVAFEDIVLVVKDYPARHAVGLSLDILYPVKIIH